MDTLCIIVADGARARFFSAVPVRSTGALRLEESSCLVEPERQLSGKDVFSSVKSGRKQSPGRGPAHGMDDHRMGHRREVEGRFAKRIADEAAQLSSRFDAVELVVVAEPRLLGFLRPRLDAALPRALRRTEIAEDLSWHALPRIRRALERRGVLPKRATPRSRRP